VDDEAVEHLVELLTTPYSSLVPMRTPPRFSVASERPVIIELPRSAKRIQSPWRHTPG
jgi:hypothetical protein